MRTFLFVFSAVLLAGCSLFDKSAAFELPDDVVTLPPAEVSSEEKPYRATQAKVNNLLHTRLELVPVWERSELDGLAELTFQPYFYPTGRLLLDAKGFEVREVSLVTDSVRLSLDYAYDGAILDITLDKTYSRFEQYTVYIDYTAKPEELEVGGSAAITSDKGLYFIDPLDTDPEKPTQLWTQGQTESSSCWFPTIDQPNERTTQEIFITVEDRFKTLSNGALVYSNFNDDGTRTDYWQQEQDHPPYLFMLAVGEFVIAMDRWENNRGEEIMVNYYVEPQYGPVAYKIFGHTPEMLTFFSDVLDYDYPWPKYSQVVVRDYVSGAMENTTATIHGEFVQLTERELIDENMDDIIAHELFHHWFGDLVTCESWSNLPLNESFATYGEYLWAEHKFGRDQAEYERFQSMQGYIQESRYKQVPLIRFEYDDKEDMFDAHSYNKGGCILHMLRGMVGDEAFFASLSTYLQNHQFGTAEVHNLRMAFEHTTGLDLNWFFDQWFLGAGHPDLEIRYTPLDSVGQVIVDVDQIQNGDRRVFDFPLAIDVYTSTGVTRHDLFVRERKNTFVLDFEGDLLNVNVDADKALLAEKEDVKPLRWWAHQMDNAPRYKDRLEALVAAGDTSGAEVDAILKLGIDDKHWSLRRTALGILLEQPEVPAETWASQVEARILDSKTQVRASAMALSAVKFGDAHKDRFYAALNSKSYVEMAAGLEAIAAMDPKAGLEEAKALEDLEYGRIQLAVASVYSRNGGPAQHDYFKRRLEEATGNDLYTAVRLYGMYLSNQELPVIQSGLDRLEAVARNGSPWWVKYAAYESLYRQEETLSERSEKGDDNARELLRTLSTRLDNIAADETDKRLFPALDK